MKDNGITDNDLITIYQAEETNNKREGGNEKTLSSRDMVEDDVELGKNKVNSNLGCQQGDCYDPVDLKNDSAEIIYSKFLKNIITYTKARNEAIKTGSISVGVN